jgi:hypothetical protein
MSLELRPPAVKRATPPERHKALDGECAPHVLPCFEEAERDASARGVSATGDLPGTVRPLQHLEGK